MSAGRRVSLVAVLMTCAALAGSAPAVRAQIGGDAPPTSRMSISAPTAQASPSFDAAWLGAGLPLQVGIGLAASSWTGRTFGWMDFAPASAPRMTSRSVIGPDRWRKRH